MALTDGLIAKYDLNTDANDSVGSNNGTLVGSPTFATDGDRAFASFPGGTSMISAGTNFQYTTEDFTYATWIRPTSATQSEYAIPFGVYNAEYTGYYLSQDYLNHNSYRFTGNDGSSWFPDSSRFTLSVDIWTHLVIVRTGSTVTVYKNGSLEYTDASEIASTIAYGSANPQLTLGNAWDGQYGWQGDLDDTRIWNRALSASEVTELHAESLDIGVVAKYDLNTNANDSVGSNNGTLQGDAAFAADGDRTVLTVDGTGAGILASDAGLPSGNALRTMSCWAKTSATTTDFDTVVYYGTPGTTDTIFQIGIKNGQYFVSSWGPATWSGGSEGFQVDADGQWHHLVATYDGTISRLYIDGSLSSSGTMASVNTILGGTGIGIMDWAGIGATDQQFDGSIDDVRIWNRALSASEVATLHSTTAQLSDALVLKHDCLDEVAEAGSDVVLSGVSADTVDGRSVWSFSNNESRATLATPVQLGSAWSATLWFKGLRPNSNWRTLWKAAGVGDSHVIIESGTDRAGMFVEAGYFVYAGFDMPSASYQGWHHLAIAAEGGTTKFYVDGAYTGSVAEQSSDSIHTIGNYHTPSIDAAAKQQFADYLDDVRIYNKALTQTEIQSIMTGYDTPDTTAPVITVTGANPATINAGATYTDAGATAVDNIDGALAVVTTGADAISVAADANWSDVTLLLPLDSDSNDVSGNNNNFTVVGATPMSAARKKFGAGSALFTAETQVLQGPSDLFGTFGSGTDITIEAWVYPTSNTSAGNTHTHKSIISKGPDIYMNFGIDNGKLRFYWYDGSQRLVESSSQVPLNQWSHVAVTIDNNSLKLWINGTHSGSGTFTGVHSGHQSGPAWIGHTPRITGAYAGPDGSSFPGNIDEVRITNAVRYTSNFSVPTAAHPTAATGGAIAGTHTVTYTATDAASNEATATRTVNVIADTTAPVITVLGTSPATVAVGATYTDAGATAVDNIDGAVAVVTTGLAAISSTNVTSGLTKHLKFDGNDTEITLAGNASMVSVDGRTAGSFVADGDYIDLPDVAATGNAPRSIAFWVKYLGSAQKHTNYVNFVNTGTGTNGKSFNVVSYAGTHGIPGVMGYNNDFYPTTGTAINDDTWHHVAATFDGTTLKMYVDGALDNSTTKTYNTQGQDNKVAEANHESGATQKTLRGKMDDLRFYDRALTAAEVTTIYDSAGADTLGAVAGTYTITYTATDAASNQAQATRTVVVAVPDTTNPVITLTGNATVTVENGSSYTDAGATATDDTDGNITANIVVSGDTVNPNADGAYTIRYNVSDAAGNAATEVTRVVTVVTSTNYATLVEGLNKYNSASHTNVVGTGAPTGEIGISPSGTGISLSLNAALLASGVKIWQKDSSHNWTVYDATPQDEMIIPWISSITALYFQLTVASSQAIRVTKMTSGLLYDVDKTDDDDTPTTLFHDGVSQPIVPVGEGTGGGATITTHAITDWASGAMQTLSVTAGATPVVQVIEEVPSVADANFSDVKLLLPLDSDFTGVSTNGHAFVANSGTTSGTEPTISTAQKKFGAGSLLFDGQGGYLSSPPSDDFSLGMGDFTIEMWYRPRAKTHIYPIVFRLGPGWDDHTLVLHERMEYYGSTTTKFSVHSKPWSDSHSYQPVLISTSDVTEDQWVHLAMTREGSVLRLFVDGTLEASVSDFTSNVNTVDKTLIIGRWHEELPHETTGTNAYVDDVRLTKGLARYTTNFAVPTAAHPTSASGPAISTLKFESDYKIDNSATDSVKVTKLSAGTANAKVKIIE